MYILPSSTLSTLTSLSHHTPSIREALSGVFGSISLACWIFLLLPQLLENYRNQSAEALSLAFILVWFVGDVANLFGGLWAGLVPTIIAIAVYFCITDAVLVSQCLYYGIRNRRREGKTWLKAARESVVSADINVSGGDGDAAEAVASVRREHQQRMQVGNTGARQEEGENSGEEQPLLKRTTSGNSQRMSPAQRRSSIDSQIIRRRRSSMADNRLSKILEEQDLSSGARLWFRNILSILAVFVIGTVGWFLAYQSGAWKPVPLPVAGGGNGNGDGGIGNGDGEEQSARGAQVLGYVSAVAYLGARIPQIVKNWREQSCEGLSLLFFMLSLCGNLTYGASILCHSTERAYVIKNVPWLIGSLGTMVEDVIIFVQFHIYGTKHSEVSVVD